MENIRLKYLFLAVLSVLIISFQSCNNDDDGITPEENSNTDTQNNTDTSNTDNQGNNTDSNGLITLYKVKGEDIVKDRDYQVTGQELAFQKDTKKHQEIWDLVKKVIPLAYRSKMSEFAIYSGEKDGSAGYVFETEQDLSKWQMGIAIDFAYEGGFNANGELAYTIIHEFGHILTLDKVQVDSSISSNDCKTYHTGEGCSRDASYINNLYQNHWADIWSDFQEIKTDNDAQKFYDKHQKRFVTSYASTNPGEDIAEVFATFVTRNSGVKNESGAEKKIEMMYAQTELITLRDYIRGNISKSGRSFLPAPGSWKNANTIGNKDKLHCGLHRKR